MALIKEYFELTKNYQENYGEKTILLMQVGSFFEVYGICDEKTKNITGSRIVDFSQICELNIVDKNSCVGQANVIFAGFKDFSLDKYVKKIQDAGFTAVVYEQDEAVKNTTRSLAGIYSPGTYFQTESQSLSNSISCIWINLVDNKILKKGKFVVVGVANIDIFTGKTSIFQFKEKYFNNPTTYDELQRYISIYNPSECILISNIPDESEMDQILSYAGIHCNLIHKIHIKENITSNNNNSEKIKRIINCEKQPYQKEILSKFYKFDDYEVFSQNFYEYNMASQAFCYLLDFVYQHNPYLVNKLYEPIFENCSNRLSLANHTLSQLNMINDGNDNSGKYSSVSKMLNECLTPMGKRMFHYNILNPNCDVEYLQREYNITEYFLSKYDEYSNFLKHLLSSIRDLSKWQRQIYLKKISPKSFCNLNANILTIQEIFETLKNDEQLNKYFNIFEKNYKSIGDFCNKINKFIESNLVLNVANDLDQMLNFETNFIQNGIDQDLDKKTQTLKEIELKLEAIRAYLSSLIENKEKKSNKISDFVKIYETEKNNFSLLSTSRRCKILQDALPKDAFIVKLSFIESGISHKFDFKISKTQFSFEKQSSANNCIVDDQINGLCKMISNIKISMKDQINLVFNRFVNQFEQFQNEIECLINYITTIDLIYCKGIIAKKYNYCKPNIVSYHKSFVEAKQLRHCLIEQFDKNEHYISNDLILGNDEANGILLYGTNAVGKTSLIKALGIAIIMAQAGLYVPCSSFNYQPYKYIFSRIIGNDNIFKGLSTFAVEMSELRTILRLMDENSLVLGDELCSGTETMSAISIFVAGIQQLYKCGSSFIFATHLHEIVDFEEITSLQKLLIKHMSVIYDRENDILVYDRKLQDGSGNNMYGLEVCKSLSLPDDFISAAYEIRTKYCPESGSILSLKSSRYNAKKIVSMCEKCGKYPGKEVHHLTHQSDANEDGVINNNNAVFHKNNLANLMTLCEDCHNEFHKKSKKGSRRVKTTKGFIVKENEN